MSDIPLHSLFLKRNLVTGLEAVQKLNIVWAVPRDAIHRHIAKQIRSLAKQQGWSGNRLADTAGVSRAQLSRLLTLQTSPTIGLLKKIAAALDVDTRDLLPPAR